MTCNLETRMNAELEALEGHIERDLGVLGSGNVAAFALEVGQVVVALEIGADLRVVLQPDALASAVFEASEERGMRARWVVLVATGGLPRTGAGAPEREICRALWQQGRLAGFARYENGERRDVLDGVSDAGGALGAASTPATDTDAVVLERLERELGAIWSDVLGVPLPTPSASFFALGGSSVDAAQVATRVRERLGLELDLQEFFEASTLSDMARALAAIETRAHGPEAPIAIAPRTGRLPLSSAQERMRFAWQLDPLGAAYNICGALELRGVLDVDALARALGALAARHESLRVRFPEDAGETWQQIDPPGDVALPVDDLAERPAAQRESLTRELLEANARAPFDLERGPLWRARVVRLDPERHVLCVCLHHAIADGASMDVLVAELCELYAADRESRPAALAPLRVQYADYARWQAERLATSAGARQLEYWTRELAGEAAPLALPTDRARPATPSQRGGCVALELDAALGTRTREAAREHDASVFMVLLAAFDVLLARYSRQRDVRVGVPAINRVRREAEPLIGLCVNTLVIRARIDEAESFSALLAKTRRSVLAAQSHQELPFDRLVEALSPEREPGVHPLFQVMFNHQRRHLGALERLPALSAKLVPVDVPVTRFDLSLNTEEDEHGRIRASLVYAADLFDRATIERLGRHFVQTLDALLAAPMTPLGRLSWLSDEERGALAALGTAPRFSPPPGSVEGWIRRRAAEQPAALALTFGADTLSYGELDRRAEALGRRLQAAGAGPERIVGVFLDRQLELPVVLLAILKAGAAYLPLDPEHPRSRLAFQLEDAGVGWVVTQRALAARLPERPGLAIVSLDDATSAALATDGSSADAAPLAPASHPESIAYVLYTSGSTGRPKAVASTRAAMAERLAWMQHEYGLSAHETLLHKTPLTFDVAVWEVFWPLLAGAHLVIAAPGDHKDPRELARLIQKHEVGTIHFVPSLLRELVAEGSSAACSSLRRIFSGGEALPTDLARAVQARWPAARVDNRYGPTEALINASYWTCQPGDEGPVPIGAAIPNGVLRIVDPSASALPPGLTGELCIGGSCLARGYLGRPGLTAERFVPDPFGGPGARLYRTGDLARFRPDGAVEFLGRRDEQVKIRGVRLELGELEGALRELPGVVAAAARAWPRPSGSAVLVAYVVAPSSLSTSAIEAFAEERLPTHLLPSAIVRLESLPRLSSGKLDRRRLPEPTWQARGYVAPEGAVAESVAHIWEEVLSAPRVGLRDDFFALGGHSLLATRVVSRVRRELDVELPLRDLFEARDLGAFVARVEAALGAERRARQPVPEPVDRSGPLPLSHAQERMWFLWQLEPESAAYNIGGSVRLRGALNVGALEAGLAELQARHEALRTTFPRVGGVPVQRIAADVGAVRIAHEDLGALPAADRDAELRRRAQLDVVRPFDLEHGPLFRVTSFRLAPDEHVLVVTLHHIIAEGWAMDVFAREYVALYEAFSAGLPSPLAPLPVQYAEYAVWQRRWLASGEAERQLDYWRQTLGDEHPVLELPADRPRPASPSYRGDWHRISLGRALTERIESRAVERGVTVPMVLTTALLALLFRYTGERRLRVGYPVSGRVRPEFEGLIGAFLNTQVLACEVDAALTVGELLARVRSASLEAQSHQDVPFHQIVDALAPERSASHTPLFQVMCNVQSWEFQRRRAVAGLELEFVDNDARAAQFDLALDASQIDGDIQCAFSYSVDRFELSTIERYARHWRRVLEALVSNADPSIGALPLLDAEELGRELRWARGERAAVTVAGAHELFEARVARAPQALALIAESVRWSYAELEARANQLARALRARGIRPGDVVGCCGERAPETVLALLGIAKAGAVYLPLDPAYPAERLRHMIVDSRARCVLVHGAGTETALEAAGVERWPLSAEDAELREQPSARLGQTAHPDSLAYCIYTSGSTGVPKGVACTHRGLVNRTLWLQGELGLGAGDRPLARNSLNFDVSVGELWAALASGATLVLAPAAADGDPVELGRWIREHGVTTVDFVPALLDAFVRAGELAACPSLRALTVGGEALPRELSQACLAAHPARLYNMYGPTEAAVDVAYWRCRDDDDGVPIGTPMANVELFVLDPRLEPVPPLVTGELYIGGAALALGYVGRAVETAQRFVPHPWARGERLYRTGDLVRRRADGVLEFIGRVDAQVKVRGHRIELGEIEARLWALDPVREAVVSLGRGPSGARLVAHVVLGSDGVALGSARDAERALRSRLAETLPDYMIPADIVVLEALPRLPNGKLDRNSLPAPAAPDGAAYVAPETETEQRLAAIWRDVLGVERVGAEDNFFELGGDSIISLSVVHRARERGLPLSPKHLFQHQTVRALAAALPTLVEVFAPAGPVRGSAALTPMQRRFFAEEMPERAHYNQALLLRPKTPLAAPVLRQALALLVSHHDALRFRYVERARVWEQTYAEPGELSDTELLWELEAPDAAALARVCQHVQRAFQLGRGPLLRAALIDFAGGQRLLLAAHHLVVDGVSWRIVLEDLGALCQKLAAGEPAVLGPKTTSFTLWGEALETLAREPSELELAYWLALSERPAPRELPRDREGASALVRDRETAAFHLDAARTAELLRSAPEAYRTQVNDLLLAALARALCRFAGERSVWIELESHGRQDCFDGVDLSRSVGWFTSAFPVCLSPALGDDDTSLESAILSTKEELRGVPRGGLGFGVYAELGSAELRARLARAPRARVTFNYLGQLDQSFGRGAAFELAAESAGPLQSDSAPLGNWLGVLGQVSGDRLEISLSYSREMYDGETIARLALSYRHELELLIAHALRPDTGKLSPADFPLAALGRADLDGAPVRPRDVADIYPLTPMQQGLLFHAAYSPGEDVYLCQVAAHVQGLDPVRFADAWQAVALRHESLRTSFHERQDGGFFQVVHRTADVELRQLDLRDADASDAALERLARAERAAGFDLTRPPLMRLVLARLGEHTWRFIWTHHHVLMDGWSSARVLDEVLRLYAGEGLGPRPGSYREYVEWIARRDLDADERFWRTRLATFAEPTLLGSSLPRRSEGSGRAEQVCRLSQAASAELGRFARRERITLSTLVQGAWLLLLSRYTGQASPVFGATVAGRPVSLRGAESRVGLFINTVPVIGRLDPAQTAGGFLRALSAEGAEMREHEHTPLHEIQRWAGLGGQPLFDTIVVFENYPLDEALGAGRKGELRFDRVASVDVTSYAVSVMVHAGERLRLKLDYSRQAFDEEQARAFAVELERLVLELARAPERRIGALPWVTADERERLARANATRRVHAVPRTLDAWVDEQCARTPHALAAICGDDSLTYAALNERAERLARHLRTLGVGPDVLVGLCLERSLDLPVAMLGILKAGGAYVPLDPEYPLERLSFMMQDSGIALLVGERRVLEGRPSTSLPVFLMDEDFPRLEALPANALPAIARSAVEPQHLAYCIYTSGSTGQPKGVEVTHGSLVNFLASMREQPGVTAADRILGLTSLSFDISALEIYLPWCAGGAVVLVDRATARDPVALARAIDQHGVTWVQATPSTWRLLDESGALDRLAGRRVLSGGEALPGDLARRLGAWSPEVWNVYGPTETTVWSSLHRLSSADPEPLIGRPLANTSLHVLGATLDAVPGEAAGELYIGGDGLARGYHGRPSLTAARFVPDPFATEPGARMYRTGDLVRRRADGALEYLSRLDHQVKIRGHRIELGEIEARLLEDAAVRQAVVVAQPAASGAELVAYVVANDAGLDDGKRQALAAQLGQTLRAVLPAHMVPHELMLLETLPLTQNGKIDRRALPRPGRSGAEYVAPGTELGIRLAQIWREVLDVERVGLNDNFFNLGGHSLLATRVISRIHAELAMDVPLRHLFETQSLEQFERAVQGSSRALAAEDLLFVADLLAQEETQ